MHALNWIPQETLYTPPAGLRRETPASTPFVPKLVFKPSRGQDTLKMAVFGGVHGDEHAGIDACYELMRWAWNDPQELQDYELHVYPICNPSGREQLTRHSLSGVDLNREFWSGSQQPEVQYLEKELRREQYHGIISLHSDDESHGLYGFVSGALLSEHVLAPALRAASAVLPMNNDATIDGFSASMGLIKEGYKGILSAPPEQSPKPLEIVFETPGQAPMEKQIAASVLAVKAILAEYRELISYAADL